MKIKKGIQLLDTHIRWSLEEKMLKIWSRDGGNIFNWVTRELCKKVDVYIPLEPKTMKNEGNVGSHGTYNLDLPKKPTPVVDPIQSFFWGLKDMGPILLRGEGVPTNAAHILYIIEFALVYSKTCWSTYDEQFKQNPCLLKCLGIFSWFIPSPSFWMCSSRYCESPRPQTRNTNIQLYIYCNPLLQRILASPSF